MHNQLHTLTEPISTSGKYTLYKEAWMAHANQINIHAHHDQSEKKTASIGSKVKHHVTKEVRDSLVTAAAMGIMSHAAQSQITGPLGIALRTTGRVAVRAIPIIGVAWAAYSIYDHFS